METSDLIQRLNDALDMRKIGNCQRALDEFENLERRSTHPEDFAALRLFQAMCLTDLGRVDDALERISRVDEKNLKTIDRIDYEAEYARIRRAKGMPAEALDHIEHALRMADSVEDKRRVEDAKRNLRALFGILLAESGKCDDALPILCEVPERDPWWAEARLHAGDCMYKKKAYREAIQCYKGLVSEQEKVHPLYRDAALRNIGFAYFDLGEYRASVEYLQSVLHSYDNAPDLKAELFRILASAYSKLGLNQEAAEYGRFSRGTNSVQ